MRGTQGGVVVGGGAHGIIPAYAGNTPCIPVFCGMNGDHPRVCGEHRNPASVVAVGTGSSPRMRGTRGTRRLYGGGEGIIPAYAGNTRSHMCMSCVVRDHPRVCGEHRLDSIEKELATGSSPRMRGTLLSGNISSKIMGIIPAYAGNTRI